MKLHHRFYLGDCRSIMADLPDACVDLVITDPPYGVANDTVIMRNNGTVWHSHDFGWWDYFKDDSEFIAFTDSWVKEAARLLRPCGSFYSFFPKEKIYILVKLLERYGLFTRNTIIWHKTNPVPQMRKVNFMSATEAIVFATKNKGAGHTFNWHLGQQENFIEHPICGGGERSIHPTQKPLAVIMPWIIYSSCEGDVVLDCFGGSGTTSVACKKLRRNSIYIDINEDYLEIALSRMSFEQQELFDEHDYQVFRDPVESRKKLVVAT